jgi:hypothetical protein
LRLSQAWIDYQLHTAWERRRDDERERMQRTQERETEAVAKPPDRELLVP